MLNIPLHSVDAVARDVLAIGTDYTPGTLLLKRAAINLPHELR